MLNIQYDFDQGKREVESYFSFLGVVEQGLTTLVDSTETHVFAIDVELSKILKANAFLLLYNLVESTLRNGLWQVHSSIQSEGIDYVYLESQIKELLVGGQVRKRFEYGTRSDSVTKVVCEIIEKILYRPGTLHPTEKPEVKFNAGNLDVETIRETFKTYGIREVPIRHNDQKEAFKNTRRNRNDLAHGNMSFNDCGKIYGFIQLDKYKNEIFDYLQKLLDEIDSFIRNKKYKKS